jgi:hypothetical protein
MKQKPRRGAEVRVIGSGGTLLRLETDWIEVELR